MSLLVLFKFSKFLPKIFIIRAVGVTIPKKIILIIIGEINLPSRIRNLNQILFNGVRIFEFNKPKVKKIKEIIRDQILIFPSLNNGNIATIKKIIKKIIPKFLFISILVLFFFKLN